MSYYNSHTTEPMPRTLTLENVKETLMLSYKEHFKSKILRLKGEVIKQDEQEKSFILTDNESNRLRVYISDEIQNDIPYAGDTVTIEGYLNPDTSNDKPVLLQYKGSLIFWFRVLKICNIERCEKSKEILLYRALQFKKNKNVLPEEYLYNIIYNGRIPKIHILCTETAQGDICQGIGNKVDSYNISYETTPLSRKQDAKILYNKLKKANEGGYDVIVLSRGGNDDYDIFYEDIVYNTIINSETYYVAGIAHTSLKGKFLDIFDRTLYTPNELGHYLKDIAERVERDKEQLRAQQNLTRTEKRLIIMFLIIFAIIAIFIILFWK